MGWYYGFDNSRRDVIHEVTEGWDRTAEGGGSFQTIRHCAKGNVLYAVHEKTDPDGSIYRFIGVYLLSRASDGWGYKPQDETMGPCQYNCPVSYIEMAEEKPYTLNDYAREWRAEVRRQAAARAKVSKPKVGDTIIFKPGIRAGGVPIEKAVVTARRGRGIYARAGWLDLKVSPKHIERIERA